MTMLRSEFEKYLLLPVLWACLLCAVSCGFAQDNPFATRQTDPDAPAAVLPTELPAVDPSLPEGTRLVIRALRESNPQTEIELAKAIELMLDVEQYQQANYYLSRVCSPSR